jgi:hypothetical protein
MDKRIDSTGAITAGRSDIAVRDVAFARMITSR